MKDRSKERYEFEQYVLDNIQAHVGGHNTRYSVFIVWPDKKWSTLWADDTYDLMQKALKLWDKLNPPTENRYGFKKITIDWETEDITVVYSGKRKLETYRLWGFKLSHLKHVQSVKDTYPGVERSYGDNSTYSNSGKSYAYRYTEWIAGIDCQPEPMERHEFDYVTLTVLPTLHLQIELNKDGKELIEEWMEINDIETHSIYFGSIEGELFEDVFCNSAFDLDPDDDGRFFITQASVDNDGYLDPSPGDLGWYYNHHAIQSWVKTLYKQGKVLFSCWSLGKQRTLVI